MAHSNMFKEFINQLLGVERSLFPIVRILSPHLMSPKSGIIRTCSEKYQRDIEALRQKYGDAFKTGLCINLTLQEALSIMHRERKRIDAYSGLVFLSEKDWNITLTITSQKLNLQHYEELFIANGEVLNAKRSIEEIESRVQECHNRIHLRNGAIQNKGNQREGGQNVLWSGTSTIIRFTNHFDADMALISGGE